MSRKSRSKFRARFTVKSVMRECKQLTKKGAKQFLRDWGEIMTVQLKLESYKIIQEKLRLMTFIPNIDLAMGPPDAETTNRNCLDDAIKRRQDAQTELNNQKLAAQQVFDRPEPTVNDAGVDEKPHGWLAVQVDSDEVQAFVPFRLAATLGEAEVKLCELMAYCTAHTWRICYRDEHGSIYERHAECVPVKKPQLEGIPDDEITGS